MRNYGIDLLRLVLLYMIVVYHVYFAGWREAVNEWWTPVFLFGMVVVCGGCSIVYRHLVGMPFVPRSMASFVDYQATHIWFFGIVMIVAFSRFAFKDRVNGLIAFLVPSAFLIYLIHACTNLGCEFQSQCTALVVKSLPNLWTPLQILLVGAIVFFDMRMCRFGATCDNPTVSFKDSDNIASCRSKIASETVVRQVC